VSKQCWLNTAIKVIALTGVLGDWPHEGAARKGTTFFLIETGFLFCFLCLFLFYLFYFYFIFILFILYIFLSRQVFCFLNIYSCHQLFWDSPMTLSQQRGQCYNYVNIFSKNLTKISANFDSKYSNTYKTNNHSSQTLKSRYIFILKIHIWVYFT
jgi:hypothetical protein